MSKLFDYQSAEARLALADAVKAALAETYEKLHEAQLRELTRLTEHLTKAPRSTWRVVQLAGDDTPHDVSIEFPAQVVYIANGSTANVQVRAPGDIAQSPPIAAGGHGSWLIPGATQLTVTGTGIGQVRLRFLNEAAARLLYTGGPGGSTASPLYAELTGSLAELTADAPKLLGTFPYSDFSASGSYGMVVAGLSRNARERTFTIYNDLNESLTSLEVYPYDSTTPSTPHNTEVTLVTPLTGQSTVANSQAYSNLAAAVDSMNFVGGMGATAPTSGNIYIYVTEVF